MSAGRGPTDEYGLCMACGGHGVVMTRPVPPETRWGTKICEWCDRRDRVTPIMEQRAEDAS